MLSLEQNKVGAAHDAVVGSVSPATCTGKSNADHVYLHPHHRIMISIGAFSLSRNISVTWD